MKYVLAVSGGVDSIVLLDMFIRHLPVSRLIVAHFDHGTRDTSGDDAVFVETLAKGYGCAYVGRREELGAGVSEAQARKRRYAFLHTVAREAGARLVVAHHLDDLVETVALQLQRGTGWRGLTPFGQNVDRPLLSMTKQDIMQYAAEHTLLWREDETNQSDAYARNRIRPDVARLPIDIKRQIEALYMHQWVLRTEIEQDILELLPILGADGVYERKVVEALPLTVQLEVFRELTHQKLTRPQRMRCIEANQTMRSGAILQAGAGVEIHFTSGTFTVKLLK